MIQYKTLQNCCILNHCSSPIRFRISTALCSTAQVPFWLLGPYWVPFSFFKVPIFCFGKNYAKNVYSFNISIVCLLYLHCRQSKKSVI